MIVNKKFSWDFDSFKRFYEKYVKGSASKDFDNLGKAEQKIREEASARISAINKETNSRISAESVINNKIDALENAIGSGGTIDERIAVEATVRNSADVALGNRVNTLETAVGSGGSIDERLESVKNNIIGNASADYNTLGKTESAIQIEANRAKSAESSLLQLYESLTQSDIVIVPEEDWPVSPGVANKIYRVTGENSYTDYMFNIEDLVNPIKMAEYDNATEDEIVDPNGNNLPKSKAVVRMLDELFMDIIYKVVKWPLLSDGTFGTSSNNHAAFKVRSGERYIITNGQASTATTTYTRYAFATSDEAESGGNVPLVDGTSVIEIPIGGATIVTIPVGCEYLLVNFGSSYPLGVKGYAITDDAPVEGSEKFVKSGKLFDYYGGTTNNNDTVYAVVDPKNRIVLSVKKNGDARMPGLGIDTIEDAVERIQIIVDANGKILSYRRKDGSLVEGNIECKLLNAEDVVFGPNAVSKITDIAGVSGGNDVLTDNDGYQQQPTKNVALITKKADQLVFAAWTPKIDMPNRYTYKGEYYNAGVQQVGIPYSATYEKDKRVGLDVSIETFMTAVNNPYSLLYTEVCSMNNSTSVWYGEDAYHGINDYAGSYYGNVCAEFVDYCIGLPHSFLSGFFSGDAIAANITGKLAVQDAQCVKIGDLLSRSGHVALVRNVHYDTKGHIDEIVVSEQSGRNAHQTIYTPESFNDRLISGNDTIYRPLSFESNTEMWEFDAETYIYNNDICTFAGNKACFREGELIVLNYNLDNRQDFDYTAIELYKDEQLFATYILSDIDQSELPEGQRNHAIKLPNSLTYGRYKARLVGNSVFTASDYTEFNIVEADVTATLIDNNTGVQIRFSSRNAIPMNVSLCFTGSYTTSSGEEGKVTYRTVGRYVLSNDEISTGIATIHYDSWFQSYMSYYYDDKNYTVIDGVVTPDPTLLKVSFKNEFGSVTNEPIPLHFKNPE